MSAAATAGVLGGLVFVALGGVGLAQNATESAQHQDGKKIVICHKAKNTISVSVNAWPAHQRHGDTEGACVEAATTRGARTNKGKKAAVAAPTATAASTTTKKGSGSAKKTNAKWQPSKPVKKTKRTSSAATTTSDSGVTQSDAATKPKKAKTQNGQKGKKGQRAGGKPAGTTQPAASVTSPVPEDDGPGSAGGQGNGNGKSNGK